MAAVLTPSDPGLTYSLNWSSHTSARDAATATEGVLEFRLLGETVWSAEADFSWTWVELLEWLAKNWSRIEVEDGLPFDVEPLTTVDLRNLVKRVGTRLPQVIADEQELLLWEFLEAHDFNRSLRGASYTSLVVWREGLIGHVLTDETHATGSWATLRNNLTELGNDIADRVDEINAPDRRTRLALSAWQERRKRSTEQLMGIASGLFGQRLNHVARSIEESLGTDSVFSVEAPEHDELLAAARMSAALPGDVIVEILEQLANLPKASTAALDAASGELLEVLDAQVGDRPYDQGYAVAQALREITPHVEHRFDPKQWLVNIGIEYREVVLGTVDVDAIACWGDRRGPAVVINSAGRHSRSLSGRNASIAHEIAHLLLDRRGALPAAEVLGGRLSPNVEARARAFAAEVLLPRLHAGTVLEKAATRLEAERAVRSLTNRYRVSREVAAWQAKNSTRPLHEDVLDYLRSLVGASARH